MRLDIVIKGERGSVLQAQNSTAVTCLLLIEAS
jgi:hypothetical protein